MSGVRRLLLDDSPGERRGVVLLDGLPERLLLERDGEATPPQAGARAVARVKRVDRGLGLAFVDLGAADGVLPLEKGITEGLRLQVEIVAPARRGKLAKLRAHGAGEGEPRLLEGDPPLEAQLQAFAPGAPVERGESAREAADLAEESVLAVEHPLGAGASLAIEETRGLTAIDVDVGGAGAGDKGRGAARINRAAIAAAARLLRLKGLAGLVVIDLVGRGEDGPSLLETAKAAFATDMPGVAFGPVSRLGVLHLAKPWRGAPVAERLRDIDGGASPRWVAQNMARTIEREARTATRIQAACAPEVAAAASAIVPSLLARLGPRFDIRPDPALAREVFETRSL